MAPDAPQSVEPGTALPMLAEVQDALGLVKKEFPQLIARRILTRSDQNLTHAKDLSAKEP